MDRLTGIVRCQWRAYWRRFSRARNLTAGHQGVTLIITSLLLFKYLALLRSARLELAEGNPKLTQSLFAAIFLAWLFLPISSRAGASFRGLLHLPLSLADLFALRIATLLITPYSWLVLAGSLAICYPLAQAPAPLAAMTAALLFISMSGLIGLALSHILSIAVGRRMLFAVVLLTSIGFYFLASNNAASFSTSFTLLSDAATRAALGNNPMLAIGLLLALNALALGSAMWSFRVTLANADTRQSRRKPSSVLFKLPTAVGTLAAKDVRYFRTLLDPYFGVLASGLCCLYLVSAVEPTASVAWIFIVIVFIPNAPLAFNSFGLDTGAAFARYALMPVTGGTIVRAKNLAFVIIVTFQLAPIILLTCWRLGLAAGALGLLVAVSVAVAYLTWGNWLSISLPAKMHPFRFAPATASLPEVIAGLVFGSLPGILVIYVLLATTSRAAWLAPLILVATAFLYSIAALHSGKRFERRRANIALSITLR